MAYIKKKDKAMIFVKDFLEKNGKDAIVNFVGDIEKCKLWNDFPICVRDICADAFVLIKHADDWVVLCGSFDDDNELIVSKETFEKYWLDLSQVDFSHIDYVVKKFEAL